MEIKYDFHWFEGKEYPLKVSDVIGLNEESDEEDHKNIALK